MPQQHGGREVRPPEDKNASLALCERTRLAPGQYAFPLTVAGRARCTSAAIPAVHWRGSLQSASGWRVFSGAVALVAGVVIGLGLPASAWWALGAVTGANFLATGISYVATGAALEADTSR